MKKEKEENKNKESKESPIVLETETKHKQTNRTNLGITAQGVFLPMLFLVLGYLKQDYYRLLPHGFDALSVIGSQSKAHCF